MIFEQLISKNESHVVQAEAHVAHRTAYSSALEDPVLVTYLRPDIRPRFNSFRLHDEVFSSNSWNLSAVEERLMTNMHASLVRLRGSS